MLRIVVFCLLLFSTYSTVYAQINVGDIGGGFQTPESTLTFSNVFPEPGTEVRATLTDYSTAIGGANIAWYRNDVLQSTVQNQRSFVFTAGALGETDTITVQLTFQDGTTRSVTGSVRPTYLDIILEADTYTPSLYKGRPLPSSGSTVRATALVSYGDSVSTREYSYRWTLDGKVIGGGVMLGAQSVTFTTPLRVARNITVEVYDVSGGMVAQKSTQLPSVSPQIQFYESSSLYGRRPYVLTEPFTLFGNARTVEVVPYHYSTNSLLRDPLIEWSLTGETLPVDYSNPFRITLENTGGSGQRQLKFTIYDKKYPLQTAQDSLSITY